MIGRREFTILTGLSDRQLQTWRYRGLVRPQARVSTSHYRQVNLYSPNEVVQARFFQALRKRGCSVQRIRSMMPSLVPIAGDYAVVRKSGVVWCQDARAALTALIETPGSAYVIAVADLKKGLDQYGRV